MEKHENKHLVIKKGDKLIPVTEEDSKFIYFMQEGDMATISTDDTRQVWRHRKFFALLKKTIEFMPEELSNRYGTTALLLRELKIQTGNVSWHTTLGSKEVMVLDGSIAFLSMGEKKFKEFVNDCKTVILKCFLTNMTEEQFDNDFMTLLFD